MKSLRWSATLLLLSAAAGLVTLAVFAEFAPAARWVALLGASAMLLIATLFGKRGV